MGKKNIIKEYKSKEEDVTIRKRLNFKRNNVIYVVVTAIVLACALFVYMYYDSDNTLDNNDNNVDDVVSELEEVDVIEENDDLYYVSCDDNTSLLNVRNSTSGNIIDGLSCYKNVTVLEEIDGTSVCDKWYMVSYEKNNDSYTGYVCGAYLKKLDVSIDVVNDVRELIDKANDYYGNNVISAYCGNDNNGDTKNIVFDDGTNGEYVKSIYKDITEMNNYLLSFMDSSVLMNKIELSDYNKPKLYDNYYMIEGNLYCRNYSNKKWDTYYTGNYDIEITSVIDDIINVNVSYEYLKEDSSCDMEEIGECNRTNYVYEIGKIVIDKGIITKIDFYK